jgi:hypothetical protein
MHIWRIAESFDNFKSSRFLALNPERVDRIDDFKFPSCGKFTDKAKRVVEVAAYRDRRSARSTAQRRPALAAYAAAAAEVFPVDAQMTAFAPRSAALEIAIVIPRSLKEPVGFSPSYFK